MKRADLEMSMIIKAIIGLIIFIILILIFTGKIKIFSDGVFSCDSKGGGCVEKVEDCPGRTGSYTCPDQKYKICCLPGGT